MAETLTVVDTLIRTETWFRERGIASPRLDAELLLAHVLNTPRLHLYLQHDRPMSPQELGALRPMVVRRGAREPLSWIVGTRAFHGIELLVEPGVLDPRPDTETLVDAALERIAIDNPCIVADIGCGSGAVGLAIAAARPLVRLFATDIDPTALRITRRNVERLGLSERVAVLGGDLLEAIPAHRSIDWVVSNPPYIETDQIDALEPEVSAHEPRLALDGGADGLEVYRRLLPQAFARASAGVAVEIGHAQSASVSGLLRAGGWQSIATASDLAGNRRVVTAEKPTSFRPDKSRP